MSQLRNPLELYRLLDKSNCGQCRVPSCMAFAVAVIQGEKRLADCPHLDAKTVASLEGQQPSGRSEEEERERMIAALKERVATLDLAAAAERVGGRFVNGALSVTCLGKEFLLAGDGTLRSECHVIPWVQIPLMHYALDCRGRPLAGEWVVFGDLKGASDWGRFFAKRCVESLRELADVHQELLFEILDLFGAQAAEDAGSADHAVVLHPLPRVPFRINYWQAEDDFASELNILFDRSAEDNINPQSIYLLGRGIVEMLRVLIPKHNREGKLF